jgi:hypothetical protein
LVSRSGRSSCRLNLGIRIGFFAGNGRWSDDWNAAVAVMNAAPMLSVHWNKEHRAVSRIAAPIDLGLIQEINLVLS